MWTPPGCCSFSFEVVLSLFALKVQHPGGVHINRGNHETKNMSKIYGFEGEVRHKYDATVLALFHECFQWLPLAACVEKKVFVAHGGRSPSKRGVGLSFGPDVTRAFLERNGLDLVVRSHEVRDNGYEVEHGGSLITVFS